MANRYANLVGSNKIKDEYQKINTGFDGVEQDVDELDSRLDTILNNPDGSKDAELVDIRTPDPSYTPGRTIDVAGDITRDMQARQVAHEADYATNGAKRNEANTFFGNITIKTENSRLHQIETDSTSTGNEGARLTADGNVNYLIQTIDANGNWQRNLLKLNRVNGDATITGSLQVNDTAATITSGPTNPEGAVTAPVGSIYLRTNGGANSTLYVKESGSGNTGWVAK